MAFRADCIRCVVVSCADDSPDLNNKCDEKFRKHHLLVAFAAECTRCEALISVDG